MAQKSLETKLTEAISDMNAFVDWSETDGKDVSDYLKDHLGGAKGIREHKAELLSLLDTKDFRLNLFQKQLIYEKLGGQKNHFYKA